MLLLPNTWDAGSERCGATQLLEQGRYEAMFETAVSYPELNALFAKP